MFRRSAVALAFALSSCSAGTVAVGVTVPATGSSDQALTDPSAAPKDAPADGTAAAGCALDGRLTIERVRVLLNEVELKGGVHENERGPFVVTLSGCELANGVAKPVALADFAAGHYTGSELEIEPPEPEKQGHGCANMKGGDEHRDGKAKEKSKEKASGGPAHGGAREAPPAVPPELEDFQRERASVLVDGTFEGRPFKFAARVKAEQESDDALDVKDEGQLPLNLVVTPEGFFRGDDGRLLDPTIPENHGAIARSLCLGLDRDLDAGKHEGHDKRAHGRCTELPLKR